MSYVSARVKRTGDAARLPAPHLAIVARAVDHLVVADAAPLGSRALGGDFVSDPPQRRVAPVEMLARVSKRVQFDVGHGGLHPSLLHLVGSVPLAGSNR